MPPSLHRALALPPLATPHGEFGGSCGSASRAYSHSALAVFCTPLWEREREGGEGEGELRGDGGKGGRAGGLTMGIAKRRGSHFSSSSCKHALCEFQFPLIIDSHHLLHMLVNYKVYCSFKCTWKTGTQPHIKYGTILQYQTTHTNYGH